MFWKNSINMTDEEIKAVISLRDAGCKCELPLLGYHFIEDKEYYRCRMCGIEENTYEVKY